MARLFTRRAASLNSLGINPASPGAEAMMSGGYTPGESRFADPRRRAELDRAVRVAALCLLAADARARHSRGYDGHKYRDRDHDLGASRTRRARAQRSRSMSASTSSSPGGCGAGAGAPADVDRQLTFLVTNTGNGNEPFALAVDALLPATSSIRPMRACTSTRTLGATSRASTRRTRPA
jgi:hypothetical protein